jgi:hypothetical protein
MMASAVSTPDLVYVYRKPVDPEMGERVYPRRDRIRPCRSAARKPTV